jgi:hypothetical protein
MEHLSSPSVFSGDRVTRSLVLHVCFVDRCLSFFFWSLCCLFFFDIRILIAPLVSSNSRKGKQSCSTSDTRRVNLVINPVISHERGKDREVLTTSGTYPWSIVTQLFHNGQPSNGSDRKTFEVMTST